MTIKRSVLLGAAALVFSTAAFAQATVKIGLTGPLTGGSAPLGTSIRDGVKLAVSEINAKGGIGGHKIELIERDDESKPERGVQIAQELISNDKIVAAVGIANTPVALAASRFYQESKTPIIIPVATGSVVSRQFLPPEYKENFIFRIGAFDTIQSAMMAKEMVTTRSISKVAILADSTNYGQLGKDDLVAALDKVGVKPVSIEKFNVKDVDMTPSASQGTGRRGARCIRLRAGAGFGPDRKLHGEDRLESALHHELEFLDVELYRQCRRQRRRCVHAADVHPGRRRGPTLARFYPRLSKSLCGRTDPEPVLGSSVL